VEIDTIAMNTTFCTVVLSVIQGIALNTGVLPFAKGRALQQHDNNDDDGREEPPGHDA
jgi:hypothetical protein